MKKKILSILLSAIFVFSLAPSVGASTAEYLVNQDFSEFAEGEMPTGEVSLLSADSAAVMTTDDGNKVLVAKAEANHVSIRTRIMSSQKKLVFSADVLVGSTMTTGSIFNIYDNSNNSFSFINLSKSGALTLPDGKKIGSLRCNEWKRIAIAADFSEKRMDVYVNGNCVLSSWKFYTDITAPADFRLDFEAPGDGAYSSVLADNIMVYEGDEPEKPNIKKRFLPLATCTDCLVGSLPAPDDTPDASTQSGSTKVYFAQEFTARNIEMVSANGNILEIRKMPEGDPHVDAMYFERTETTDRINADFSLNEELWPQTKFVIDFEVYLIQNETGLSVTWRNADRTRTGAVTIDGNKVYVASNYVATIEYEKWQRIAVAHDVNTQTYTAWVNGEKVCDRVAAPNKFSAPRSFGFYAGAGSEATSLYIDNARVYLGSEPHDKDVAIGENGFPTVMEQPEEAKELIGDAAIFMTDYDSLYFNGEKQKYSLLGETPVTQDGVFMISSELFDKVFPGDLSKIPDTSLKSISGVSYVPLESVCKNILGYSVYHDNRKFIMVDTNSELKYFNSEDISITNEPIDVIYRYIQHERKSGKELLQQVAAHSGAKGHPRLLTDAENLERVKKLANEDELVSSWLGDVLESADNYVNSDVVEYKFEGSNLLTKSRSAQVEIVTLCVAYLLTDDVKYADAAWRELENVCNWPNWNQGGHHLDCSELLLGVAVGYDSLYYYLTDEQKKFVVDKSYEYILQGNTIQYAQETPKYGWQRGGDNWAVVCASTTIAACLAFGTEGYDEYQEEMEFLLSSAMQTMERPLMMFFPDGGWFEGAMYWNLTVKYLTQSFLAPLYYSTGSVGEMLTPKGVSSTLEYILYMQAGKGVTYNYADAYPSHLASQDAFFIPTLAGDDALTSLWLKNCLDGSKTGTPTGLLWYNPPAEGTEVEYNLPKDKFFESSTTGHMIGQWGDTTTSYVAFRTGSNSSAHAHLDNGSFIFDALGERWAMDLGPDDYNIPGGYHNIDTGYQLYRKRPEGHNNIVINFREDLDMEYYGGQAVYATSTLKEMQSKPRGAFMVADLSDVYRYDTKSYIRGYYLGDDRATLTVQDEFELLKANSDINWFMHTEADVTIAEDGKSATLTIGSKEVRVEALCDADSWYLTTTEPAPHETAPVREGQLQGSYTNAGITRLTLKATGSGKVNITVKLVPVKNNNYKPVEFIPISNWTIPDGEIPEPITLSSISAYGEVIDNFDPEVYNYSIDVRYGEEKPTIEAASDEGSVRIEEPKTDFDPVKIYLADDYGNEYIYTVRVNPVTQMVGIPDNLTVKYGTASASQVPQEENPPEHIVDGNLDTRWAAQGAGPWCQTDLGEVVDIEGVALAIYDGDNRIANFELHISEDGENWKKIYDGSSTGTTSGYEAYMINTKARYIRFVGFQSNVGSWNSVLELGALVKK